MANCPKCRKSIPFYKFVIYIKWIGIKCDACSARLFISTKDCYSWSFMAVGSGLIALFLGAVFLHLSMWFDIFFGVFIFFLFWYFVAWPRILLDEESR